MSLALNRSIPSEQLRSVGLQTNTTNLPATAPTPLLLRAWQWFQTKIQAKPDTMRLQMSSSLSLGDKRSVCVIQVDGRKFLVGGTPNTVVMLADLGPVDSTFALALNEASAGLPKELPKPAPRRARAAIANGVTQKAATTAARKPKTAARKTQTIAKPVQSKELQS